MNTCRGCDEPTPDGTWCTGCLLPDHYRSHAVISRPVEHVTVTGAIL